jgi:hypothetical protein
MSTTEPDVKLNQADVNYSKGRPGAKCGICKWFIRGGACTWVKGKIDPEYWCEIFTKGKSK